jgi:hypothetical protein
MEHGFTSIIRSILVGHFGNRAESVFQKSSLLQYVNTKTKSASRGAKSRSAFANHYALFVLLKDYVDGGFLKSKNDYAKYEGAKFSELLKSMRSLPFGNKLQNHALNNRLNHEFRKFFPESPLPIIHVSETQRYWINENLLIIPISREKINIAPALLEIIDAYIETKQDAFNSFRRTCQELRTVPRNNFVEVEVFIRSLLQPNVDARIFEIVSYSILKQHYSGITIFWGWTRQTLIQEELTLYKTGRTNANDGGIDFVMKPLGRFFQVTETTDVKKYFLDIDKVHRYPVTFVVKTNEGPCAVKTEMEIKAKKEYSVEAVVEKYMSCIEEIINIPILLEYLTEAVDKSKVVEVFDEIILQSDVEFNFTESKNAKKTISTKKT